MITQEQLIRIFHVYNISSEEKHRALKTYLTQKGWEKPDTSNLFVVTVTVKQRVHKTWIIQAKGLEWANMLFKAFNDQKVKEGDEPLILPQGRVYIEPLEMQSETVYLGQDNYKNIYYREV